MTFQFFDSIFSLLPLKEHFWARIKNDPLFVEDKKNINVDCWTASIFCPVFLIPFPFYQRTSYVNWKLEILIKLVCLLVLYVYSAFRNNSWYVKAKKISRYTHVFMSVCRLPATWVGKLKIFLILKDTFFCQDHQEFSLIGGTNIYRPLGNHGKGDEILEVLIFASYSHFGRPRVRWMMKRYLTLT